MSRPNYKHTPGPWIYTNSRGIKGANGKWVARIVTGGNAAGFGPSEANGWLIAAAPEMLDALKVARNAVEYAMDQSAGPLRSTYRKHLTAIEDAIAKAESPG